jgi:hypothetical protein
MSQIFPQVGKSLILRSEPFLLRLVTDQRNKNCCVWLVGRTAAKRP